MKDKIIQIATNSDSDGHDVVYGLSESGDMFLFYEKDMTQPSHKWIKLLESPFIDERKMCDKCKTKVVNILKKNNSYYCHDCYYEQT
jgi:hypothetical protein